MAEYDIIGDVHGSGAKLRGLLDLLGWARDRDGVRRHPDPERRVIFVGDLVDRGDDQLGVLETVKGMVDDGVAQIVMGNHEFNAISYATLHPETGRPLRAHSEKNWRPAPSLPRKAEQRRAGRVDRLVQDPSALARARRTSHRARLLAPGVDRQARRSVPR